MMNESSDIGRLVAFGLQPRSAPGKDSDYRDLVARYLNDSAFQDAFDRVVAGMGLEVIDCRAIQGIVLAPIGEASPFHTKLEENESFMSPEERYRAAVVFLTIAALSYPSAAALDDEEGALPRLAVADVVQSLDRFAARVADTRSAAADQDPPAEYPLQQRLYQAIRGWSSTATEGEAGVRRTKTSVVRRYLKRLVELGCADEVEKDVFRMRARFRVLVRYAAERMLGSLGGTVSDAISALAALSAQETK